MAIYCDTCGRDLGADSDEYPGWQDSATMTCFGCWSPDEQRRCIEHLDGQEVHLIGRINIPLSVLKDSPDVETVIGACPHWLTSPHLLPRANTRRNRAIFIDRDDCLIRDVPRNGDPALVRTLPMIEDILIGLQRAGYLLVIVTNAGASLATGAVTIGQYAAVNERMLELFIYRFGLRFDALYFCPHYTYKPGGTGFVTADMPHLESWNVDQCPCRKPRPGMVLAAAHDLDIDLSLSWMIGDRQSDIEAGRTAGCKTMLIDHRLGAP